jgi:hypothetical protein
MDPEGLRSLPGVGAGARADAQVAPGELEDLLRSCSRSVFRLETLDDYSEGLEDEDFRSWSHGNAPPPIDGHWWYDGIVRAATSGHKRWDRVHMLRQPPVLGDYLRYSFEYDYPRSEEAGESCHVLEVPEGRSQPLPREDFWLFDDEFGVVLDLDAQGRWRRADLVTYPPAVSELRRRRDIALALAVPFWAWSSKSANLRMHGDTGVTRTAAGTSEEATSMRGAPGTAPQDRRRRRHRRPLDRSCPTR